MSKEASSPAGTVMYLLDNGTEGATKRFTASFAFSFAFPEGVTVRPVGGASPVHIRPHRSLFELTCP
ncbi:hypothetical protein GCM10010253_60580 [Streptomyces badius]|uniref:Uncharacterized protein n=1 Tax=Streptomyces badius TaxID=1941 RepID=A0ABQ2TPG1_STRBA|nr:hypothetical protein GCM10010253_60580 [Streptomyces badius]